MTYQAGAACLSVMGGGAPSRILIILSLRVKLCNNMDCFSQQI